MKTAILLGAGTSVPAGFPSTNCLTKSILSGAGIKRNSDCTYQLTEPDEDERAVVQLVNCAVRHIHGKAKRYFEEWRESPPHYEHLYYVAQQVWDEEMGEMENPTIGPFAKELKAELTPLLASASGQYVPDTIEGLYREIRHYIADVVWRSLLLEPNQTNHLKLFAEACRSGRVIGISTLCHDTHVETYLKEQGITLADGFSAPRDGYRYWKDDFSSTKAIPFLKLHGSTDWFLLGDYSSQICIPPAGQDSQRLQSEDGTLRYASNGRPELLIGTFNKLAEYSQGISLDLYYRFRATLNSADQLVICGYSFGDKGINTVILEWFAAKPGRRFVIIHPEPDSLIKNARGAIKNRWEKDPFCPDQVSLKESTTFMPNRLEEVAVEDFLTTLNAIRVQATQSS